MQFMFLFGPLPAPSGAQRKRWISDKGIQTYQWKDNTSVPRKALEHDLKSWTRTQAGFRLSKSPGSPWNSSEGILLSVEATKPAVSQYLPA